MSSLIFFLIGIGLIVYSVVHLFKDGRIIRLGKKRQISLETIAPIWVKQSLDRQSARPPERQSEVIQDSSLKPANIAVDTANGQQQLAANYIHHEIQEFYERHIEGKAYFRGTAGEVIKEILKLLDEKGDCPSVVNKYGDPDKRFPKDAYEIHARVTLLNHTLRVAEAIIGQIGNSIAIIPKGFIAALSHDLGKIVGHQSPLYSMGDHPLISIALLGGIKGFSKLSYKDDIISAIKEHHHEKLKELFSIMLQRADHEARRNEIVEYMNRPAAGSQEIGVGSPESPESSSGSGESGVGRQEGIGKQPNPEPHETVDHYGSRDTAGEKEFKRPEEIELPWFDPDEFLNELKPYINRLNGGRWDAFSMPDGYVYFQIKVLEEAAKKLGRKKKDPDAMLMDTNRDLKHRIIYSIVSSLRREKDAIARGLIKDEYFGGPFILKMRNGSELKGFYTPFKADAFTETVSELETKKVGKIRDIVEVAPRYEETLSG